ITNPGSTATTDVASENITVPVDSLLLSWVRNEGSATATAQDSWTLDPASVFYLWAEQMIAGVPGTYFGHFAESNPIGWQTAVVSISPVVPPSAPTITSNPANPTNQTSASFSFSDTQAGVSFLCQLDGSGFSACTSPQAYAGPLSQGSHTFSVEAKDAAGNVSTAPTFTWTINTTPPPAPSITSNPANPTNQTSASFSFSDTQAGVTFLCQLDGSAFSACVSPQTYSGLSQGSHTFAVEAKDTAGNLSTATSFTWTINTTLPPAPTITSKPANPTNQTNASFSFSDTQAGVNFLCQLDGSAFNVCTSPVTYSGPLSEGKHSFSVKAQDIAGNRSAAASFTWTIDTTPPPAPSITSNPANPSDHTSASFSFSDTQTGVTFL